MIQCPVCGAKGEESEYHCGYQAHISRPSAKTSNREKWADYLFFRDNIKGVQAERWQHRFGCGKWFNMLRCTVTMEIKQCYAIDQSEPEQK